MGQNATQPNQLVFSSFFFFLSFSRNSLNQTTRGEEIVVETKGSLKHTKSVENGGLHAHR